MDDGYECHYITHPRHNLGYYYLTLIIMLLVIGGRFNVLRLSVCLFVCPSLRLCPFLYCCLSA